VAVLGNRKAARAVAGRDGVTRRSTKSGDWSTIIVSSTSTDRPGKCLQHARHIASYEEQTQESRMTERVMSGLTWRGLETDLR
jgi:hypothetical protein